MKCIEKSFSLFSKVSELKCRLDKYEKDEVIPNLSKKNQELKELTFSLEKSLTQQQQQYDGLMKKCESCMRNLFLICSLQVMAMCILRHIVPLKHMCVHDTILFPVFLFHFNLCSWFLLNNQNAKLHHKAYKRKAMVLKTHNVFFYSLINWILFNKIKQK